MLQQGTTCYLFINEVLLVGYLLLVNDNDGVINKIHSPHIDYHPITRSTSTKTSLSIMHHGSWWFVMMDVRYEIL